MARLASIENIIGLKDATGDVSRVAKHRELCGEKFILLSGDDATSLDFIAAGGNGVISVTNNIVPKQMADFVHAALAGDMVVAQALNAKIACLHQDLFLEANPIPVKWALKEMGLIADGHLRLPLTELAQPFQPQLKQALLNAGAL